MPSQEENLVVVGGGYVGLPLAVAAGKAGMNVTVFDTDPERVRQLQLGESYIADVSKAELAAARIKATAAPTEATVNAHVIVICVPTPLRKTRDPDVSCVITAAEDVARCLWRNKNDVLVVLESTVYPGFTREVLVPILEKARRCPVGTRAPGHGLLSVAFSPERVDPANVRYGISNTPKVIGGVTEDCQVRASSFYGRFVQRTVPVSSCDTAEMVKLLENTFRAVNIGLANEVALMCHKLGVETHEVIEAAATKPFGYMPFYPGPGVGGHCIGLDPLYLSWKLRAHHYRARFIELADEVNLRMPKYVVGMIATALNSVGLPIRNSSVVIYGVAYKENVSDVRESPALEVMQELHKLGARMSYVDPLVPQIQLPEFTLNRLAEAPIKADCAVILAAHDGLPRWEHILQDSQVVVDTRGYMTGAPDKRIYRL